MGLSTQGEKYPLPPDWHEMVASPESILMIWDRMNEFPIIFDDSVRGDFKEFLTDFYDRSTIMLLTGDYGFVRVSKILIGRDAEIHLFFWDRKFKNRDKDCKQALKWLFEKMKLERATIVIPGKVMNTFTFVKAVGFTHEGLIRRGWKYNGRFLNLHLFGILREEVYSKEDRNGQDKN
jgi:hypothetical protein